MDDNITIAQHCDNSLGTFTTCANVADNDNDSDNDNAVDM